MTMDDLLMEKVANWGHDEDEILPMIYRVYYENDEWDDWETFDDEDSAMAFMEEMEKEHGCKCRFEEEVDWDEYNGR